MSISAWPSIEPSLPFSASRRASSTSRGLRKARKTSATRMIISGPPTNSPATNCQPSSTAITIPSSATRFVEAISKAIAAVKSAPWRKSERASATAAYEHEEEAAPRPVATASVRGESSGSSRRISCLETTAWTAPESAKPRMSAQRISQVIPPANESARTISCPTVAARIIEVDLVGARLAHPREPLHCFEQLLRLLHGVALLARRERAGDAVIHVAVEDLQRERIECGRHGADLREDVDAVPVFLDHLLDPAHLTLDAVQAFHECLLVGVIAVGLRLLGLAHCAV